VKNLYVKKINIVFFVVYNLVGKESGKLENWKTGKLENWKTGKLENWKCAWLFLFGSVVLG